MRREKFTDLLSAIVDNRGRTCPVGDSGIPLIATNCVRNDLLYPAFEKVRYISRETHETWFRGHPQPGDIIFVCKGSPGRVCLAPDPVGFCIAQDMVAVRPNPKRVYPLFLFALLRSAAVQAQIENMHVGTLIPHFKKGDFDKLTLEIPDDVTQRFVGDLYFELSMKIELNRKMNATLESIARALFKSWFVDFDPVRAKAEGRTPTGMDAGTAKLFPSELVESELGPIPKGWCVGPIRSVCSRVQSGGTPKRDVADFWYPAQVPWLTSGEVRQPFVLETAASISLNGLENSSAKLWPPGTTIVAMYGATAGEVTLTARELTANQACCGLLPRPEGRLFVYVTMRDAKQNLAGKARGSAQQNLNQSLVADHRVVLPPASILAAFEGELSRGLERSIVNLREMDTLARIRDELLPRFLSGELDVSEASRELETLA